MLFLTGKRSKASARKRFARAVVYGSLVFAAAPGAHAEEAAVAARPKVTPPKPLSTAVTYPEKASGDASVILELTVEADGTVSSVGRVEGPEPFAEAARRAALSWKFDAADRDGKKVRSKIRFEARFIGEHLLSAPRPEPEETPAAPAEQPTAEQKGAEVAAPGSPSPEPAYSVTVRGQRAAPGGVTLSRTEARLLPGAFGDPFRAVTALPGVTPVVSVVPLFFLRGAPPGNVGYYVDGIRVPVLFHALLGPPAIQPALIDRVEVYPGAAPARYGRYAGGIVAADSAPMGEERHASAALTVLDLSGVATSPFADGRAHATAAGRISYTQLTVSQLSNLDVGYWDYQLRASYDATRNDVIGVFAFGSLDFAGDKSVSAGGDTLGTTLDKAPNTGTTQFHRIDLRYDHSFSANTRFRLATTLGYDRSALSGGTITDLSSATRFELQHHLGAENVLRFGADVGLDGYTLKLDPDPTLNFRDATILFPSRTQLVTGAYLDFELHATKHIVVRPGLRTDLYRSQGLTEVGVDPRISASYDVSRRLKLIHTFGMAHQTPNYLPNVPGVQIGGLAGGLQKSVQYSAGFELALPEDVTGGVTLFQQNFFDLSDPLGFSRQATFNVDVASLRGMGYAFGAELMLRRPLTRTLGGIVSYTLSRSVRSHESITSLSAFDHTHVVSAALGYDLGNRFTIGARGLYISGVPTSRITANGPVFDGERAPGSFRLDLRIEKRFRLGAHGYWGLLAEVVNVTATREVISRTCSVIRCTEAGVGPIVLPNVGVEVGY